MMAAEIAAKRSFYLQVLELFLKYLLVPLLAAVGVGAYSTSTATSTSAKGYEELASKFNKALDTLEQLRDRVQHSSEQSLERDAKIHERLADLERRLALASQPSRVHGVSSRPPRPGSGPSVGAVAAASQPLFKPPAPPLPSFKTMKAPPSFSQIRR